MLTDIEAVILLIGLAMWGVGLFIGLNRWIERAPHRATDDHCWHTHRVPVDLVSTGEVVAELCIDCWEQLPVRPKPPKGPSGISPSADGSR